MKIAIYARKSVEVKDSVSIDTQIEMCKNYFIDEKEAKFEVFTDDGFTGANINRPSFRRMYRKIKLNMFDNIVCYKLDRISRSVVDIADFFEELKHTNTQFICVKDHYDTSTPMGRAMLYFASVFAQLEREQTAERVTDSMLNLAKSGCWTGGPAPFGYRIAKRSGKSYLELENADMIKDVFNTYLQYGSLYATHKLLKDKYKELPKQCGNLRRILESPMYVKSDETINEYLKDSKWIIIGGPNGSGYLTYNKTNKGNTSIAIVSQHEAVIEPTMWLKVQEKIEKRKEDFFKKDSKTYWLSGLLKCPYCGAYYILVNSGRNFYYACGNRVKRANKQVKRCENNKYVNAVKIESKIEKLILKLQSEHNFNNIYSNYKEDSKSNTELTKLNKEIKQNSKMISNLVDKLALLDNISSRPLLSKITKLTNANEKFKTKIEEIKMLDLENNTKKFNKEYIKQNITSFNNNLTAKEKKSVVRNIFKEIIYDPFEDEIKIEFL